MKINLKKKSSIEFPIKAKFKHDFSRQYCKGLKKILYLHLLDHVILSYDLWMLRINVDTFIFIVNDKCEPCYIIVEFLEITTHFKMP